MIKCVPSKKYTELNENKNDPKNAPKNALKNKKAVRQENILETIKNNPNITISQLSVIMKISRETIKRDVAYLMEQGKINKTGKTSDSKLNII